MIRNIIEPAFGFGSHLIVDCYGCSKEKLEDVLFVHDMLDTFPEKIGMTKISEPHVFRSTAGGEEMTGVSGVVLVAESHISVHTFPETGHVFIDIFSCKDFNTEYASQYLSEVFVSSRHEVSRTSHGIEFQPPRERALAIH
ncbi:MAG: adenosylmethionine decarboxylase [Candidatus Margulisbacteria bacterium]|nr:adenosylmethionine decarboxylase [Candidatus Margulisiibacteriota bacterium]MBU1617217.1 adenosylmethionine decarboxylase [Candidatus Margulisiibacteriota bacterium]MBU1867342.1 adenosylmethionine decarboxylase [Candidatus Margulisiibacteriota bacterium]